jgi:DNA-binding PadR family transcriptional regulator
MPPTPLNHIELLSLIAIVRLGDDAYGVTIQEEIERSARRRVSMAGVYSALDRLERQGLARARQSEPRAERGGRARRLYGLTAAGRELVKREREAALRMWRDLPVDLHGR